MELGCVAQSRGVRVVVHDKIDSTNSEAKRLVVEGEYGPLWIIAREQTAGRGRLGRSWESPFGNLYASLILSDLWPARVAPQLGFVAGLATLKALDRATGANGRLTLKWPNDVLLDGKKLAGILLEAVALEAVAAPALQQRAVIIGIGVNCEHAPSDLPYPAIDLSGIGDAAASAATVFSYLSDALIETFDLWAGGEGFAQLRAQWLSRAAGLGGRIRVALAQESIEGRFTTIDGDGRLVLALDDDRQRIVEAGDVFLPQIWDRPDSVRAVAAEPLNK